MKHAAEFRRCLIEIDVTGIMRLSKHVFPHVDEMTPAKALIALHMARVKTETIPERLREYSRQWLADCAEAAMPNVGHVVEAVGIASKSNDPRFSAEIVRAMRDALLDGVAKGITEAPMQKELMMKARQRVRFQARV